MRGLAETNVNVIHMCCSTFHKVAHCDEMQRAEKYYVLCIMYSKEDEGGVQDGEDGLGGVTDAGITSFFVCLFVFVVVFAVAVVVFCFNCVICVSIVCFVCNLKKQTNKKNRKPGFFWLVPVKNVHFGCLDSSFYFILTVKMIKCRQVSRGRKWDEGGLFNWLSSGK